ncbi:MAG: UDP-3-O-[3-hydroxymyristoyl] N-acetylglucosamine deacetylase [Alphaproteobacteria bacterium]|nr:UDP-3-O-[3-hydroxymyristoyl] N-acetylglucosamine deacetylase [Alphaproteobacteria bacterium]
MQHTVAKDVIISGVGLHSGCESILTIKPAEANTGIIFKRIDIEEKPEIKAIYSNVVDTKNCTCIGDNKGNIVSTIEHLMAALCILEIDNALIEINNPEVPIMDGSALPFYKAIKQAGTQQQSSAKKLLKILRPTMFVDEKGAITELTPADNFCIKFEIEFPSKIVGKQKFEDIINDQVFEQNIAMCRTFCEKYQVDYLKSIGLIKGGSLDNAVVLDGENILNEGGFRTPNECVNHKVIDAIGDMFTAGYKILGKLTASKSGHYHNNQILRTLFDNPDNYEITEG